MRWSWVLLVTSLCGSASVMEHPLPTSGGLASGASTRRVASTLSLTEAPAIGWQAFASPVVLAAIERSACKGAASEHGGFKGADDDPGA